MERRAVSETTTAVTPYHWWQTGIIYQVYPRSFADSNGDGVGDLVGITGKLDYLQWLGVDALWLSPIYPSPMADFGYDVADYTAIHPLFGTLAEFDGLLREAHQRDIKLVLDLAPNHSSDEHPWFRESRSSRDNPRRDWYVWRDPAPDGGPPNNWLSHFGGPAWTFDAATGQYYLHLFDTKQPDLNWRNLEVRTAIYDAMRFWLDRGVDGFRIDVIWLLIKDARFRDNPPNPRWKDGVHDHGHRSEAALLHLQAALEGVSQQHLSDAGPSKPEVAGQVADQNRALYLVPWQGSSNILGQILCLDGRRRQGVVTSNAVGRGMSQDIDADGALLLILARLRPYVVIEALVAARENRSLMRADEPLKNEDILCHDAESRRDGRGLLKAARSFSLGGEGLRISFANTRLSSAVSVMIRCSLIVFSATSRALLTR